MPPAVRRVRRVALCSLQVALPMLLALLPRAPLGPLPAAAAAEQLDCGVKGRAILQADEAADPAQSLLQSLEQQAEVRRGGAGAGGAGNATRAHSVPRRSRAEAAKCSGRQLVQHLPIAQRALKTISNQGVTVADGKRYESCAVIGNSGNMQGTRYGAVIDTHQIVIRLNQAPTEGYEPVVGSKASYRLINKEWVKKYTEGHTKWLPLEEGVSLVSRGDPETRVRRGVYVCILCVPEWADKAKKFMSKQKDHQIVKLSANLLAKAWHMVKSFIPCSPEVPKKCPDCKPSSGILAVAMALSMCDKVTVYGMAGTRVTHAGWPYHYYSFHGTELTKGYSGHMFEVEKELVAKLGADSLLTLCGPDNAVTCATPHWQENSCCQSLQAGNATMT
eukprot:jgi/Tetstr1/442853/TSEL_003230.t1